MRSGLGREPPSRARAPASICVALGLTLVTAAPSARAEDNGIPVGTLLLRPSISADLVFDSNVYRSSQDPQADLGLQIVPALGLLYPGDNLRWSFDVSYRFLTYFNVGGNNHDDLRVFNHFRLGTALDANRLGKIGFRIKPDFFNRPGSRGLDDSSDDYELGVGVPLEVPIRPTSAFQILPNIGWSWVQNYWPDRPFDSDPMVLGNRHELAGGLGFDWRFFPKSHLLLSGEFGHVFWGPQDEAAPVGRQLPADFWRAWFGMSSDLSRKAAVLAKIGYGNVYFGADNKDQNVSAVRGLLGDVELALKPATTQRMGVGFRRNFSFRYYSNSVTETQPYFKYQGLFFGRLGANADVSYVYRELVGALSRTEHQITAGIGLDVRVVDTVRVAGGYRFTAVPVSSTDEGEYIDNRVIFGVILGYR